VATALGYIRALYAEEEAIRAEQLSDKQKLARRVERCKPIVETFFAWCEQRLLDQGLLPTNPFTQALAYSRERQAGLSVFLADPEVPIDTNHLERALQTIPLGWRDWLFCWTEVGAKYVGIVQSLLVTCRLDGVAPYDYLIDVLQRSSSARSRFVHRQA
jgi:transposase